MLKRSLVSALAVVVGMVVSISAVAATEGPPGEVTESLCDPSDTINVISITISEESSDDKQLVTADEAAEGVLNLLRGQRDLRRAAPDVSNRQAQAHARVFDEEFEPLSHVKLRKSEMVANGVADVVAVGKGDTVVGRIRAVEQESGSYAPVQAAFCTSGVTTRGNSDAQKVEVDR